MQTIILCFSLVCSVFNVFSSVGTLDTGFGTSGSVSTNIQTSTSSANTACAVQPDGKIVVVGKANPGFAIARYTSKGVLDTTFNSGGSTPGTIVTTAMGTSAYATGVAIDNAGNIVVCGNATNSSVQQFVVARYTPAGVLDTTFNTTGYVATSIVSGSGQFSSGLVIDRNNKIIVVGFSLGVGKLVILRYLSTGLLDTVANGGSGFGQGTPAVGYVSSSIGFAYGVTLDSSGNILICGNATISTVSNFFLARYTSAGVLDTTFNTVGYVTTTVTGGSAQTAYGIALTSAGKIVLCGTATISSVAQFAVLQYTSAGALDTTFNTTGYVTTTVTGGSSQIAYNIGIDNTGTIIVGGTATISSALKLVILAYTSAGALDTSGFNASSGYNTFSLTSTQNNTGMCIQPNNNIVQVATATKAFKTVRYLGNSSPQGCIDTSYNSSASNPGYVTNPTNSTAADQPQIVALQPLTSNSNFVVTKNIAGTAASQLIQLSTSGSATSSSAIASIAIAQAGGTDVVVDSHGRAVVVGTNTTPYGWIARYVPTAGSPGSFALDSTFNGGAITVQSSSPATTGYSRVCEQASGNILAMGQNGTTGIIVAYNQDGTVNTSFATSGAISLASSTFYDMIVASSDNGIYVTYKGSSGTIKIAKYLAFGSGLATTTFGTSGVVDTGLAIASYGNPALCFDTNGNIIFAAINTSTGTMEFRQYAAATGATINATASIATTTSFLSSPVLTKLQCDTNNRVVFTGYDTNFFFVGRLTKSSSTYALDTTFAPYQSNPGNYSIAPGIVKTKQNDNNPSDSTSPQRYSNSVIISPNGGITFGGYENITSSTTIATVGKIIGDTTPYSQVARYPGARIGQVDTSFGTSGALSLAASPVSLSAGQAKAMKVLSNGKILVAIDTGSDTVLGQLTSAYALDTASFGASTGMITLTGLATVKNIMTDPSGNIYVVGDNAAGTASIIKKITSTGSAVTWTASTNITLGNAVQLQASGRILVAGYDSSYNSNAGSGVIIAYNQSTGALDTSFNPSATLPGAPGYYYTCVAQQITSLSVCTSTTTADKIMIAYDNGSSQAIAVRILENGTAVDSTFSLGTAISSVSAADQIKMQIDVNGNIVIVARTSTGFVASRYTQTGVNDVTAVSIPLTNASTASLKNILCLSDGSTLIVGMNSNGNIVIVASLTSAFALNTNFDSLGTTQGILQAAVSPMVDFYGIDVTSDQGILVCGDNNATTASANPYMTRILNNSVVTKVSQSAPSTPAAGILDATFNTTGSTVGFMNCSSELSSTNFPTATQIRAMIQKTNGTYFIGGSTSLNSYVTLMSDDDVQNVGFGSSGLVTLSGLSSLSALLVAQSGALLVAGGSGTSGSNLGWLQSYNATTGLATAGFTPPTGSGNVLDAQYAIAQQSTGRILVAGTLAGVGSIIAYNCVTGAVDTTFATNGIYTLTGYTRISSMIIDGSDTIYCIANDSSNNTKVMGISASGTSLYWTSTLISAQSTIPANNHLAINQAGNIVAVGCNSTTSSIVINSFTPGSTGGTAGTALTLGVGETGVTKPYVMALLVDLTTSPGKIVLIGYDNNTSPTTPFVMRLNAGMTALDTTFNTTGVQSYNTLNSGVTTNWYAGIINANGKITVGGYASALTTPYLMRLYGDEFVGQYSPSLTPLPSAGVPGAINTNFGSTGQFLLAGLGAGALDGLTPQSVIPTSSGQYYIAFTNGSFIRLTNALALDTTWAPLGTGFASSSLAGVFSMFIDGTNHFVLSGTTGGVGWLQRYNAGLTLLDITFNTNAGTTLSTLGCSVATTAAQQTLGRYVIAGALASGHGAVFVCTDAGALDTTFNNPTTTGGWYDTGVTSGVYALAVDLYDRILIAYKNGSNIDVVRLTSAGQLDRLFNTTGTVLSAITGADNATQVRICLDQAGNVIVAAHTTSGISVRGLTTLGANLYTQLDIATIITNTPVLTNMIATADGNVLLSGLQSGSNSMWVARVTVAGALDTTFGGGDGIMTFSFNAAGTVTSRALNGIVMYPDGQIAMVGTETDSATSPTVVPFLSMAYNTPYTTQVVQTEFVQNQGTNDITLGASTTSATDLGITFFASSAGAASSGQVARAIALQDDANIVVAVDGGASSGSSTPSNLYLKMFDIDGVANTSFGTSGQQTVLTTYQNQNVQDMITFTTTAGVHKALLAGYVTNTALSLTSSLLLQYNLDTHLIDSSFGGFDGNPAGLACNDGKQFNVVGQQSIGRIITSGISQDNLGLIVGYTANGKLDMSFGNNGYLLHADSTGLYTHAIDTQNRILIGWKDEYGQVNISRFLADGSAFDTTFNSTGTINTLQTTYSDSGMKIALDSSNNVFVAAVADNNSSVTIYSYTTAGATLYTPYTPALSLTTFFITQIIVDTTGLVYIMGYDAGTSPNKIVIARLLANLSGLDTTFNPSTGYKKYEVAAGSTQITTDALIHPDGRILIIGSKN